MERANKPMTLEQLKQMNGQPVWAYLLEPTRGQKEGWVIVYKDNGHAAVQRWARDPLWYQDYGKTWLAYAQQPDHIDREKWEPCEVCKQRNCNNCQFIYISSLEQPCSECDGKSNWQPAGNYCWCCGRPLTEEAWAELERRIFGG